MRRYKYVWSNGIIFFEKQDIKLLEKAALDGWHMKKMNMFGFYQFEKGDKQELSYAIDVKRIAPNSSDFQEYIDIFESGSWKYVCSVEKNFHFFYAPKGTMPIYTDSDNEVSKHWSASCVSIKTLCIIPLIALPIFLLSIFIPISQLQFVLFLILGGLIGLELAYVLALLLNLLRTLMTKAKSR